jgi:hypothetical protein
MFHITLVYTIPLVLTHKSEFNLLEVAVFVVIAYISD